MQSRSRNTGSRTGKMVVDLSLDTRQMQRYLATVQRQTPEAIDTIAHTLAALGKEWARDIVTVQIYATPQRGDYRRTRYLLRSIYSAVEKIGTSGRAVVVGASASYAAFNEYGTYDGWIGENASSEIVEAARAVQSDLITLEYGRVEVGLEPRPFIIPALVMLERKAPELVMRAMRRITDGAR
jgi:hypothetical protein